MALWNFKKQPSKPKEEMRAIVKDVSYCDKCGGKTRTCKKCFKLFCEDCSDWHIWRENETTIHWTCEG